MLGVFRSTGKRAASRVTRPLVRRLRVLPGATSAAARETLWPGSCASNGTHKARQTGPEKVPALHEGGCQADPEVAEWASMRPHPISLQEVLICWEPSAAAKFIRGEMPVRFAERIRSIEGIRQWQGIPELVHVHEIHMRAFRSIRQAHRDHGPQNFTDVVKEILHEQEEVVAKMAVGMRRLQEQDPAYAKLAFIDTFLDGFLLNRLGCNVLMSHYLAIQGGTRASTGMIDPRCNVLEVCEQAAEAVSDICVGHTGHRPVVRVEAHSAAGKDHGTPTFSYIPAALRYIMAELLKNSCRATVELAECEAGQENSLCSIDEAIRRRPISIVVCADEQNVAVCLSDQAGGIPFEVGSRVWSFLYFTPRKVGGKIVANDLAGYGVGLPMSRLFARYLGGSLDLISLPGYGTHAYLWLPRLRSEQVEVVPDCEHPITAFPSLTDHAL